MFAPLLAILFVSPTAVLRAQAPTADVRPLELSLADAVATALENDLSLKIEQVSSEISRYTFNSSWGAFDPLLRASASFEDSKQEINQPYIPVPSIDSKSTVFSTGVNYPLTTGGAFDLSFMQSASDTTFANINPSFSDTLALSFTQPLLRGAGSDYRTSLQRENELRMHKQDERVRQARQDLNQRVADAYWDLVASLEQLAVADETLTLGREQLDQNRRRLNAGVGTEVEVLQADTNVAQRIEQRLLREVAVKNAADKLKGLMYPGTDAAKWELELAPSTALPECDASQIPGWGEALVTALAQRTELKQQLLEIDAVEQQLVRASSERSAALDFVLSTRSGSLEGSEGQAFVSATSWDFPTHAASLSFSMPIGNRSALWAEKSARAAIRAARLVYDQLESQIVEEVRSAVRANQYSVEAVRAAQASSELARRQLAAEQARYREGLSTNFQVLQFQQQLAESLYSLTFARTNLAKSMSALRRAQGVLGDSER